jgi:RNA recognition motif-containing protein
LSQNNEKIDTNTLILRNFISIDDLNDADETEEILNESKEILNQFGNIISVEIICEHGNDCYIMAKYDNTASVDTAVATLNGFICGGNPLRVTKVYRNSECTTGDHIEDMSILSSKTSHPSDEKANAYLLIENLIFPHDITDISEATEVLHDIELLCNESILAVWFERHQVIQPDYTSDNLGNHRSFTYAKSFSSHKLSYDSFPTPISSYIVVELSNLEYALRVMKYLNQVIISGQRLLVSLIDYKSYLADKPLQQTDIVYYGRDNNIDMITELFSSNRSYKSSDEAIQEFISCNIVIRKFADMEMFYDEDERQDLLDNIRELLLGLNHNEINHGKLNHICDAFYFSPHIDLSKAFETPVTSTMQYYDINIPVSDLEQCLTIYQLLKGRVIGGEELMIDITMSKIVIPSPLTPHFILNSGNILNDQIIYSSKMNGPVALCIQNYFTDDDLADCIDSNGTVLETDALMAAKSELLSLIRDNVPRISEGTKAYIIRMTIYADILQAAQKDIEIRHDGTALVACASFPTIEDAEKVMIRLNGGMIAGQVLKAFAVDLNQELDEALVPSKNIENMTEDLLESLFTTQTFQSPLHIAWSRGSHCPQPSEPKSSMFTSFTENSNNIIFDEKLAAETASPVSKYVEAKGAPKLAKHCEPSNRIPVS